MDISITINNWIVPVIITMGSIIGFFIATYIDDKNRSGYFDAPLLSMLWLVGGGIATIVAWVVYVTTVLLT